MIDFIMNGNGHGQVATTLLENNMDVRALRPWIGKDGKHYGSRVNNAGVAVATRLAQNAATLRKDEWKLLDDAVVKAAKPRLRAVADLRGAGLTFTIPNGMGKTVLETEAQSDVNPASVSMDGLRANQNDRPEYSLVNLPLPIIHKDYHFSLRQILTSRNGGSPLDTTMAELAGRRVAEEAEKLLLGVSTAADQYAFGGGTIYGYTDFPSRLTKTITSPEATGWTPATTLTEVLAMKTQSQDAFHFGPWVIYTSTAWDQYMDSDFSSAKGDNTLRDRLEKIDQITQVRTLDYLSGFDLIMVQLTSDVVREVIGMDITTVQWESMGGLQINYKVMAIMVPQLRADFNGNTGIVHGTV